MARDRLIIIGSGAAGWTAAIYAARAGLDPLVICGEQTGGQMTIAGEVENFPGFDTSVDGAELMAKMSVQAMRFGTRVISDVVRDVDFSSRPLLLHGEQETYDADAVIIATGATARWLGIPGEKRYMGRGVSACATCDGYFYRGKDVAVIGGGNTAVEEALHLSGICRTVHLVHRRGTLRAEKILQDRIRRRGNVIFHWNTTPVEIVGGSGVVDPVEALIVQSVETGTNRKLDVEGVFVAIGHDPASNPFAGNIEIDSRGYIKTFPGTTKTNVPGVFAAGDVADPLYRQAVTAAGSGCMAALDAERFLHDNN